MKYQLRQVVIEAQQFIPEEKPWPAKVAEGGSEGKNNLPRYHIPVPGGVAEVVSGDFIIDHPGTPIAEVVKSKDFYEKWEPVGGKKREEEPTDGGEPVPNPEPEPQDHHPKKSKKK